MQTEGTQKHTTKDMVTLNPDSESDEEDQDFRDNIKITTKG